MTNKTQSTDCTKHKQNTEHRTQSTNVWVLCFRYLCFVCVLDPVFCAFGLLQRSNGEKERLTAEEYGQISEKEDKGVLFG